MGNKSSHHRQHDDSSNQPSQSTSARNVDNTSQQRSEPPKFRAIPDTFETIDQIQEELRKCGLESSNLILGIDYTISNRDSGRLTFGGKNLHDLRSGETNPYQQAIDIIGRTLEPFDDDHIIPAFGFGDNTTGDRSVFPFYPDRQCKGFQEVLSRYNEITPQIQLAGPTSFAPIIREALNIVQKEQSYHILVIIADGQVTPDSEWCHAELETRKAIEDASRFPLSILLVGVGDGPWDKMEEFDDGLPARIFDNFQFVELSKALVGSTPEMRECNFAISALQEIPEQYSNIKKLGYLS
eukprot:TRINITY_DN11143_c0_g1_i1.p1 TRINITY_DN11143_c0_g1~~TRINITY_DN11143_c0_g1_i1.p1  ORF type:complete len:297 (+),score=59.65 TRINITY_DN11143_c0_g1_i1:3-893(+)